MWKVQDKRSRKFYALKKNFDAFQNSTDAQRTYREIMFLQKFKHPHIVELKEVIRSAIERDIYILFEFMDIDLYNDTYDFVCKSIHTENAKILELHWQTKESLKVV